MSGRRSSARRKARRWRVVRRWTLVAVVLLATVGAVYAGLRDSPDGGDAARRPTATPTPTPTPLASLDLSQLPIARGDFCDRLDEGDVEDALEGPVSDTSHYKSGDRVALAPGLTDVAHEYNCTFEGAGGAQARVWVFAEPVTASVGRSIVKDAKAEKGCRPLGKAPTFGTPSLGTLCAETKPVARSVTLRGLFGDAWLSCRLSRPGDVDSEGTVQDAEQWCVRVATTLGARP